MSGPFVSAPLAARGVGELAVARGLPAPVVDLFAAITELGNPWLLLVVVSLAYVVGERGPLSRPRAALVLALGLGALGLTVGLKALFELPRPPGAATDGYGFPSGHALGTTVFWGGVALVTPLGSRRRRLLSAGAVIALVAVSRVVIGVHYVVDVVVGVAIGGAFLATVLALGPGFAAATPTDRDVVTGFLAAAALNLAGLALGLDTELLLGLGTSLGGALGWYAIGDAVAGIAASGRHLVVATVGAALPLVAIRGVAELTRSPVVVVVAAAAGLFGLLATPLASASLARVADKKSSRETS